MPPPITSRDLLIRWEDHDENNILQGVYVRIGILNDNELTDYDGSVFDASKAVSWRYL